MKVPIDMNKGFIHKTSNHGNLEILRYESAKMVLIRFLDTNTEFFTKSSDIRKGNVKDHMRPTIYGVGFCGKRLVKGSSSDRDIFMSWHHMMRRCYSPYEINKNISYKDCFVCEEWHNFQNFLHCHELNYVDGYHLDKDIINSGNKIYSPENCIYVPAYVNILIVTGGTQNSNERIGVSYRANRGMYRAYISIDGKYKNLGHYKTEEEAGIVYDKEKYQYVKMKCEQCKNENPDNERLIWAMDRLIERYKVKAV